MTPKEKAEQLYKDAYMRWCYELSHDKNVSIAKNITTYMCNEILNYLKTSLTCSFFKFSNFYLDFAYS